MTANTDVADFFSSWSIYRAVVDSDSMEHREVFEGVHDLLAQRTEPYSILDLGCGDSAVIAPAMAGTSVRRYVGIDCTEPGLELARDSLRPLKVDFELRLGDLMETILEPGESFDVILVSFVLHHFDTAGKQAFLAAARNHLKPGGEIFLIDVVRKDGEARDEYLDRFTEYVRTWQIPASKQESVIEHVVSSDFPAQISEQPAWASQLGYRVTEFYRGGHDTQCAWRLAM